MSKHWIPEILYEEVEDGLTSKIPFVAVPNDEEMPKVLYVFESRETGETEPGPEGNELPVTEITLHQYVDMEALKIGLTPIEYDNVRWVLKLGPFAEAAAKGKKITENIRQQFGENPVE
tara:strand:- start:156 stop:512 length:357 start_codon:yes stop_codon:yes gene_type:complete